MIEVQVLEKSYGFARALKGISFSVQKGEVIGFLGPNGAGKSTTMKILTGYLLPTGGSASVAGLDVVDHSLKVRRSIGYLPETTPLYGEMRVDDYLRFVAEIRGVGFGKRKAAIARAVELCGLQRVTGKNINELSKGYRQRVGLAQAIVHEPPCSCSTSRPRVSIPTRSSRCASSSGGSARSTRSCSARTTCKRSRRAARA